MNVTNFISVPSPEDLEKEHKWIESEIVAIGSAVLQEMIEKASKQRSFSYAPYSHYLVGACLLTQDGQQFVGNNAERVSYSETDHGEESAVTAAIIGGAAEKDRRFIRALVVSHATDTAPCGRCRQIIMEHCDNCLIVLVDPEGKINKITSARAILPYAFTPSDLGR